jgi:hypothetical protein
VSITPNSFAHHKLTYRYDLYPEDALFAQGDGKPSFPTIRLRVPAVYLTSAFLPFLSVLAERGMNKLRVLIGADSSIPTAPTNHLFDWSGLHKNTRGQNGADKGNDPVLVR